MLGRYYEEFPIDIASGVSNYTTLLLTEALEYVQSQEVRYKFVDFFPTNVVTRTPPTFCTGLLTRPTVLGTPATTSVDPVKGS